MNTAAFRKLALSFEEVSEHPHFDRFAFKTPRRTFVTLASDGKDLNIKLEPDQQAMLVAATSAFTKLPNKWGDAGWTTCVLSKVTIKQLEPAARGARGRDAPASSAAEEAAIFGHSALSSCRTCS